MAGVSGAIVATLGCILPSCVIVMLIAWLTENTVICTSLMTPPRTASRRRRHDRFAAFSMMQSSFWRRPEQPSWVSMWRPLSSSLSLSLCCENGSPAPILVMCACGLAGFIVYSIFEGSEFPHNIQCLFHKSIATSQSTVFHYSKRSHCSLDDFSSILQWPLLYNLVIPALYLSRILAIQKNTYLPDIHIENRRIVIIEKHHAIASLLPTIIPSSLFGVDAPLVRRKESSGIS